MEVKLFFLDRSLFNDLDPKILDFLLADLGAFYSFWYPNYMICYLGISAYLKHKTKNLLWVF